jgi:hypothetical protein
MRSSTPSPPSGFGKHTKGQAPFEGFLLFKSEHLQMQCFLNLLICLIIVFGKRKVHMVKLGKAESTTFVSCSLPASVKKFEKLTSLLSHLDTREV